MSKSTKLIIMIVVGIIMVYAAAFKINKEQTDRAWEEHKEEQERKALQEKIESDVKNKLNDAIKKQGGDQEF